MSNSTRGNYYAGVVILFLAALMSSCSSVNSVRTQGCAGTHRCEGVTYSLPKRNVLLSITRDFETTKRDGNLVKTGRCIDTIRATMQAAEPDLTHQFTAQLQHQIFTNDHISVGVNPRGLLDSRDSLVSDLSQHGPDIIDFRVVVDDKTCVSDSFARIFDPTDQFSIDLPEPYANYRLTIYEEPVPESSAPTLSHRVNGLVYRRGRPYLFTFDECTPDQCETRQASRTLFPNKGSIATIPYKTNAFVKNEYKVSFRDGELVGWNADRPAEVIEIIKIPLELLQKIVEVPMRIMGAAN